MREKISIFSRDLIFFHSHFQRNTWPIHRCDSTRVYAFGDLECIFAFAFEGFTNSHLQVDTYHRKSLDYS